MFTARTLWEDVQWKPSIFTRPSNVSQGFLERSLRKRNPSNVTEKLVLLKCTCEPNGIVIIFVSPMSYAGGITREKKY